MNLVDLGSLTFNGPGFDRVEGYSNFSWVLGVAAAYALGASPVWAAKGFGLICLGAAVLGTGRLVDLMLGRRSSWRFLAMAGLGTSAFFASWSVQGLETPLAAALLVWATAAFVRWLQVPTERRHAMRAGVLFAALALTRPEGLLFGAVAILLFVLANGIRTHRGPFARFLAGFGLPVLVQLAFRVGYYGAITANTYYAKTAGEPEIERGFDYLVAYAAAKGIVFSVAIAAGVLVVLIRSARAGRERALVPGAIGALSASYAAFIVWVGGDWMGGFRFVMHVLPLLVALAVWAVASFAEDRHARRSAAGVGPAVVVTCAALLGLALYSNVVLERRAANGVQVALCEAARGAGFFGIGGLPRGPHFTAGAWLARSLPAGEVVALSEAGIVPFESRLPVLDYLGLNDRTIARLRGEGGAAERVARQVLAARPGAIAMTGQFEESAAAFTGRLEIDRAIQAHPALARHYEIAKRVPLDAAPGFTGGGMAIYVRKDLSLREVAGLFLAVPNPVPAGVGPGSTEIRWSGWEIRDARVVVSRGGRPERLFATGAEGALPADFIQHDQTYVFRLFDDDDRLLATLEVERVGQKANEN